MKGKMTVIDIDGTKTTTELTDVPSIDELQTGVGGYIQVIPLFDVYENTICIAFCNEEGKNMQLSRNAAAQRLWEEATGPIPDYLVGPVVIITGDDELMESM